jgi:hypothetical protein
MAGVSLSDYNQAYQQAEGKAGVITASALALDKMAGAAALRAPSPETKPVEEITQKVERTRETSDLMWRLNNYKTINCACGTKLRVFPNFKGTSLKCPHCGRTNSV